MSLIGNSSRLLEPADGRMRDRGDLRRESCAADEREQMRVFVRGSMEKKLFGNRLKTPTDNLF